MSNCCLRRPCGCGAGVVHKVQALLKGRLTAMVAKLTGRV